MKGACTEPVALNFLFEGAFSGRHSSGPCLNTEAQMGGIERSRRDLASPICDQAQILFVDQIIGPPLWLVCPPQKARTLRHSPPLAHRTHKANAGQGPLITTQLRYHFRLCISASGLSVYAPSLGLRWYSRSRLWSHLHAVRSEISGGGGLSPASVDCPS